MRCNLALENNWIGSGKLPLVVESPNQYNEICTVMTRGEAGAGTYSVKIQQGE